MSESVSIVFNITLVDNITFICSTIYLVVGFKSWIDYEEHDGSKYDLFVDAINQWIAKNYSNKHMHGYAEPEEVNTDKPIDIYFND